MFFKKNKPKDRMEETLANLHILVLEAAEIVRMKEKPIPQDTKQKLVQLRMEVREAHQSLELINYCLKQRM